MTRDSHSSTRIVPLLIGFFIVFSSLILGLALRGLPGNPTERDMNSPQWKEGGPFELSPERGRFALTYSLLENNSFFFSPGVAAFIAPDVAVYQRKFVSLFPPGLSYIIMPGYLIGKSFGLSQIGSSVVISLFALSNGVLIFLIARKLGAHPFAALVAALLFLFATPAFAYGVTIYQHHVTTFMLLVSVLILVATTSPWWLCIVWFLCAASLPIDSPNLFFFLPIGLYSLGRLIPITKTTTGWSVGVRILPLFTLAVMALPLLFLAYFNANSYGDPFKLGGTAQRAKTIELQHSENGPEAKVGIEEQTGKRKTAIGFFKTRNMNNGLLTHFLAQDRGMLYFTPVMFLAALGLPFLLKSRPHETALLVAIAGVVVILYSMWGDPYGGWAFGSRYLIPAYAIFAIIISIALTRLRHNFLFMAVALSLGLYSFGVNTVGAVTTSSNPPRVEIPSLETASGLVQPRIYQRNMQMLSSGKSKSFIFQTIGKQYLTAWNYTMIVVGMLGGVFTLLLILLFTSKKEYDA